MRKFSFREVISEDTDYLLEEIRNELPKRPLRSGMDSRINTLKTLVTILEKQQKQINAIYELLLENKK